MLSVIVIRIIDIIIFTLLVSVLKMHDITFQASILLSIVKIQSK